MSSHCWRLYNTKWTTFTSMFCPILESQMLLKYFHLYGVMHNKNVQSALFDFFASSGTDHTYKGGPFQLSTKLS